MADKDKEAHAAARESDEETASPPQSEMVQTPWLSDILKAITRLGSRMNNLQDQINALSQCDPAVPEQNEDLMVGDHSEEAGGVNLDCAGSAQNCDSLPDGEQQFDSSSANPKDCETDSVSELFVVVPQKWPGALSVDMLDAMASDAELNVEQTTGPSGVLRPTIGREKTSCLRFLTERKGSRLALTQTKWKRRPKVI